MKRYFLNIVTLVLSVLLCNVTFAAGGINSGGGAVPFGSNTQYNYGIMPTNLPSGGTYGASQKAADAYNAWKNAYVKQCSSGVYRVNFDDGYSTVSEGIAYGMLLAVYADDKDLFDGLWQYYQNNMNGNGVMNWKISGCSGTSGSNGATDAELDAAMALIIASEQWPSGSYASTAKSFIKTIKSYEMNSDGQTLNGDAWGNTNTCRNPSYFAPAYYAEFANVDTDNGTFWGTTAISASNTVLKANRNSTSGLVSNWCDNSGTENTCGNTGSGANGYGADACRNPWRMAVDYLWHGSSCSSAASDINAKLVSFVNGYENQMRGPFSNRSVSNPSSGSYVNGSYTTFALPPMTSSSAQSSLNKCYTAVASLADVDAYFNSTVRCITLFVLTGNFWAPGASGFVFPPSVSSAETDETGLKLTLTMNKTMKSGSSSGSNFTVYYNGTAQSGIVSAVTVNSDKTVVLTLTTAPQPGQTITLSYNGNGSIKSSEDAELEAFTKIEVLNMIAGNETILDDCEDGNEFNNVGGIWFTFNDSSDQNSACTPGTTSTISPLSSKANPLEMGSPGYDGTGYAVHATYKIGSNYTPYNGGSCASWTNPAYVGIGTWVDDVESNTMDWTDGTGVTFWYKGPACTFQVIISEVTDYCFHKYDVSECTSWTQITVKWGDLAQPTWGKAVDFSAKHVQKLQWQFENGTTGSSGSTGDIWIDEVHILGMPPVALTALTISPVSDEDLADDDCANNIDPLKIPIASGVVGDTLYLETTPTPDDASYPVVFWSSSDEDVVTVDYKGRVIGVGYGEATITARSKMHQDISATYTVKVPAPKKNPESISFEESSYEVTVGETTTIIPSFSPNGVTETGLTWTSSDPTIATVSSSGVVTGVAEGTVTITATSTAEGCSNVKESVQVTVNPVAVTAISVDPESVTMEVGGSETVTASITPQSVSQAVSAVSANTDIATVTVNGNEVIISSVAEGTTTVTITSEADNSFSKTVNVTVNPVAITGVAISGSETEILVGGTTTLTAAVTPANAAQTVTWSSSDENIATVTGGIVTGVAVGTVTITATSTKDNTKSDTYSIEVKPIKVTGITVAPATQSLSVGGTVQLSATVSPANATDKTYEWSSDDETVATVDADGLVTALKIGTCTIKATAKDGSAVVGSCAITVAATQVTSISVLPESATIKVGATQQLTASVLPNDATDKTYTWSSTATDVATVSADGFVTAIKAGSATIKATANDGSGVVGECAVTVENIMPTDITMATSLGFTVGDDAKTLTPTFNPANTTDQTVTWTSSDEAVATVVNGVVTPIGEGTCTVTATSNADNSVKAVCNVSVVASTVAVESVSLPATQDVYFGKTATLTATVTPDDATNKAVSWESSDAETVSVDANGVVTGNKIGSATITVTTEDGGKTATCVVTVSHKHIESIDISQSTLALTLASAATQLTATYSPDDATDTELTWTVDKPEIATVSSTGVVTPVAEGTAIVTVANGSVSATCTVTVSAVEITAVTLDLSTLTFTMGDATQTLTATVEPENATVKTVTWSSDNPSVATVTNGVVSPVGVGECTITATAGAKTATCVVTVNPKAVTGITLDKSTLEISVNGSAVLTPTVEPSDATNKTVIWHSAGESIATVTNGIVTGVAAGVTTITATTEDGNFFAICDVTVKANTIAVTGVTLSPSGTKTAALNETVTFTATVAPTNATNKNVTWTSSNTSVATIADGAVTLIAPGVTTITVTTEDGSFSGTCELTVTNIMASQIIIDNALALKVGESGQISLTIVPSGASQTATWTSSAPEIATVDATGKVSALKQGTAKITATTTDGTDLSANCDVTVSNVAVTAVALDASSKVIRVGKTATLTATVSPANATNKEVTWSSSKTDFATVADGVVTAIAVGTTTITAASAEDVYKKANCSVEVVDASELQTEIATANASYSSAVEGTNVGQYKVGSKSTFMTAISAAQAVFDNADATQIEIDAALAALKSAEKTFAKALIVNETLIFDAELEEENMTRMATFWFSFNDSEPGGSSVVSPLSTTTSPFTMSTPGYNGKGKAAMMEYTLDGSKALGYSPFVGMGLNFKPKEGQPFDMTGSTGVSFWMKSDSKVYLEFETTEITDACDFYYYFEQTYPEWTFIELTWSDFEQYSWGKQVDWDLTKLTKCQWKVQEPDGETGKVWIDEVKILGVALDLPEIVTKTELYSTIGDANDLLESATIGTLDGNYPASAASTFTTAIAAAQAVADNLEVTQDQVDAAVVTLNAAIATFQSSQIEVDRSALQAAIQTAKNYYSTAVEGYQEGLYIVGSKAILQSAISDATLVNVKSGVSQTEVATATATLNAAIETFLSSLYVPDAVNKAILQTTIGQANTLYSSAVEGYLKGNYPVGSKTDLMTAISAAQAVNSDANVSQEAVDLAVTNLKTAIETFKSLVITVDKSALSFTITQANTVLAKADNNTGDGSGQYPAYAVSELTRAINEAQQIYETSTNQVIVDDAVRTLTSAITVFEQSVNPTVVDLSDLVNLVAEAEDLINSTPNVGNFLLVYTDLMWNKSNAQVEIAKPTHSQENVYTQIQRLTAAMEAFRKAVADNPISAIDDAAVAELSIYPNPCQNMVAIVAGKDIQTVSVVNVSGAKQFSVEVDASEIEIDMTTVKAGLYFVQITYVDGTVETKRIVKQ